MSWQARAVGTALKYGSKAYQHYNKHKAKYKAAYAVGQSAYQMASKYRKRRGSTSSGSTRVSKKRKTNGKNAANTWSKSNSAFKKTFVKKKRRGTVNVDGTITHKKVIKYKPTKWNKWIKLSGGSYKNELYSTGILYHNTTDNIYTQKYDTIGFLFDGGVPVVGGTNITSYMNDMYSTQQATAPLYSAGAIVANRAEGIKVYVNYGMFNTEWTNMSAGASILTIYVLMAKNTRFTGNGPVNDWTTGLTAEQGSLSNPSLAESIGTKPTASKIFNMNWKIVESKTFNAGPGAKVNFNFTFQPQSVVDTSYFAKYTQVKGLTYAILAVSHGQLGLTATNTVAPKPVQWIYSVKRHYDIKPVSSFQRIVEQRQLPASISVGAAGDITVREDDGELEA